MRRIVIWLLVVMLLASVAPVAAAAEESGDVLNAEITLTKVGTVDANVLDGYYYTSFHGYGIYVRTDDGKYQILNHEGINALGESYDRVEAFYNNTWIVYQEDKGVNNCGLVKADGTVLIPVSAAKISGVYAGSNADVRYAEVMYGTEEVTDQKDAFFFVSNDFSLVPQEGDKLYAGYDLYYDLQQQGFVGDLKRTDSAGSVYSVGDKLFYDQANTIYDANGAVFASFSGSAIDGFFVDWQDNRSIVYDSDLQQIAVFDDSPYHIYGNGQLFGFSDYETNRSFVTDMDGTRIGDLPFAYPPEEYGSFLYRYDANDKYLVMDTTGKTLIDASAGVTYAEEAPLGFLKMNYEDGSVGLLYPDGTVVKGNRSDALLLGMEQEDKNTILALRDKAFTLELSKDADVERIDGAPLLCVVQEGETAMLLNLLTGEALMTVEGGSWRTFRYADGYLYVLQGDAYDIYKVDVRY